MSEEDAQELAEAVTASHAGIECEVNYGGQPVYYYIVSVEQKVGLWCGLDCTISHILQKTEEQSGKRQDIGK